MQQRRVLWKFDEHATGSAGERGKRSIFNRLQVPTTARDRLVRRIVELGMRRVRSKRMVSMSFGERLWWGAVSKSFESKSFYWNFLSKQFEFKPSDTSVENTRIHHRSSGIPAITKCTSKYSFTHQSSFTHQIEAARHSLEVIATLLQHGCWHANSRWFASANCCRSASNSSI